MADPTFKEWIASLLEPSVLLSSAAYHFIIVVLEKMLLRGEVLAPILRLSQIRDESFSRFWIKFSGARESEQTAAAEPVGSSALIPPLLATASGVVLDIGPGTGTQMHLFTHPNLTAMYGAEPCVGLHADLRAKISSCGLLSKYHILPCSAEPHALIPALQKVGFSAAEIQRGIFDTVVCVRVLCSVPNPRQTIRGLYDLLKPGGRMIVCEHVVNPWTTAKGSVVARLMQAVYTALGWSFFMGDCHMNRDTERILKEVGEQDGGWASVELERSFGHGPLPYISGVLVKRS
ncbi:hypothetical protein VTO42DRAFT_6836 [Malbranchea cinnamomea]